MKRCRSSTYGEAPRIPLTGHSQPVHSRALLVLATRRRWLDQFYEPSRDKQDVDLAPPPRLACACTLSTRACPYAFRVFPLRYWWRAHDGTIFIRTFARPGSSFDPHPFRFTCWRRVMIPRGILHRSICFNPPETGRPGFNSARTANTAGRLLFSTLSLAVTVREGG